jgi:hypothetical protein
MKAWIVPGLLALLAPSALAQQGPCPNTRASNVVAKFDDSGASSNCQLGIVLFGISIGIDVVRCPNQIFFYPAHEACLGQANPGTYCGAGESLAVQVQKCECVVIGSSSLGLSLPVCKCRNGGTAGIFGTGKTFLCIDN